jgi:carbon monoxide dehydrogenase subunit G
MKMTHSETIRCTPEALWPWLDDAEKSKQWLRGLEEVRPTASGPKRPGYTAKLMIREGGKLQEYDETILEYEPNRRFKMKMTGGCLKGTEMLVDYQLVDIGDGRTRLDYECEALSDRFVMKLLGPLFMIFGRMQAKSFFRTLRKLAEGQGDLPATAS